MPLSSTASRKGRRTCLPPPRSRRQPPTHQNPPPRRLAVARRASQDLAGSRAGGLHSRTLQYANVANDTMGKRLDWLRPIRLVSICFLVLLCPVFRSARSSLGSSTTIKNQEPATIKANSALVLVDVLVQDKRNGDAIAGLEVTDFLVRDSGKSITVLEANRGLDERLRPMQLWFLAMCNVSAREPKLPVKRESGSAAVAGNNRSFASSLVRASFGRNRGRGTIGAVTAPKLSCHRQWIERNPSLP
jgi:hypothetical protein